VKEGLGFQTIPDCEFRVLLEVVGPIGHAAWLHVVCTYGKWINICWLCSLKTLGGAIRHAAKLSSLVFTVVLILGSGQVDAAKDLWERNLGAIVVERVAGACSPLEEPLSIALDCLIRKLTLPLAVWV
jgi:hypothetical protein